MLTSSLTLAGSANPTARTSAEPVSFDNNASRTALLEASFEDLERSGLAVMPGDQLTKILSCDPIDASPAQLWASDLSEAAKSPGTVRDPSSFMLAPSADAVVNSLPLTAQVSRLEEMIEIPRRHRPAHLGLFDVTPRGETLRQASRASEDAHIRV